MIFLIVLTSRHTQLNYRANYAKSCQTWFFHVNRRCHSFEEHRDKMQENQTDDGFEEHYTPYWMAVNVQLEERCAGRYHCWDHCGGDAYSPRYEHFQRNIICFEMIVSNERDLILFKINVAERWLFTLKI